MAAKFLNFHSVLPQHTVEFKKFLYHLRIISCNQFYSRSNKLFSRKFFKKPGYKNIVNSTVCKNKKNYSHQKNFRQINCSMVISLVKLLLSRTLRQIMFFFMKFWSVSTQIWCKNLSIQIGTKYLGCNKN